MADRYTWTSWEASFIGTAQSEASAGTSSQAARGSITPETMSLSPNCFNISEKDLYERVQELDRIIASCKKDIQLKEEEIIKEFENFRTQTQLEKVKEKAGTLIEKKKEQLKLKELTAKLGLERLAASVEGSIKINVIAYQENIQPANSTSIGSFALDKPKIIRYSLEQVRICDNLCNKLPYEEKRILHPFESLLFQRAINLLRKQKSTTEDSYPNNVVLVDMFAREPKTGEIRMASGRNFPEIHTIAMLKLGNTYCLIDPSNNEFSDFIAELLENSLELKQKNEKAIQISLSGFKLYTPDKSKEKGDEVKYDRDCTDIAVKIAILLNEEQRRGLIRKPDDIEQSIGKLSNSKVLIRKLLGHDPSFQDLLDGERTLSVAERKGRQSTSEKVRTETPLYRLFTITNEMKDIKDRITKKLSRVQNPKGPSKK